jgi:hypothetical protein
MLERASPAKIKMMGKKISISRVEGSLIWRKNFFLSNDLKWSRKTFGNPTSCSSAIE